MRNHISKLSAALAAVLLIEAGAARGHGVEPLLAQGPTCAAQLDKAGATAPAAGATITVNLTPYPPSCHVQLSALSGVGTITEGTSNTAVITIPANAAAAREARFQVGDQVFRVVQAGPSALTPWNIGDVFVGAGSVTDSPGVYKTLAPQGSLKLDSGSPTPTRVVPDLLDGAGYFSSGCMVDPTAPSGSGHLFTASWKANTLSIFDGVTQQLRDVFAFTDPGTIHPYDDLHQDEVGVNTPLAALPRATGVAPLPLAAIGVADDLSTSEDEFVTPEIQGFEQVVFASDGQFYVGTQKPPADSGLGLGHGYLLRFRYDPSAAAKLTLTGWWVLDAGAIADRSADRLAWGDESYANGTSLGASGVDQFDLSSDQQTIFYTSEDAFIRYFNVVTGAAGTITLQDEAGLPLHARAFGLRILPGPLDAAGNPTAADGSAGFLVAVSDNPDMNYVRRIDATGKTITKYAVPGQPFTVSLTPDARHFWTSVTQDSQSLASLGVVYRFHIGSGERERFEPGTTGVYGLCVKREYSPATANGLCFDENADGSYGPGISACRTPAICPSRGIDHTGASNMECLPPGTTLPVYAPQRNREGDRFPDLSVNRPALDVNRPGIVVAHVLGLERIHGLTNSGGVITGTIAPQTCTASPGDQTEIETQCVFTLRVQWMLIRDYEAGSYDWQESAFTWTVIDSNTRPTLSLPSTSSTTLPVLKPASIPLAVNDADSDDHVLVSVMGLPAGLSARRRTSYGDGWLLAISGTPGPQPSYPRPYPVHVDIWDCTGTFAQNTEAKLGALSAAGASAAQLDAVLRADIAAAPPGSCHHSATSLDFTITVVNTPPTLDPAPQMTLLNTPVNYQIPAHDADGHSLTWTITNLPTGLSANASGLVTGTPTVEVSGRIVTVTVSDIPGSSVTTTFLWTVFSNRLPVCSSATVTPRLLWAPNHQLVPFSIQNVTDPDGDAVAIVITSITQNQPVNDTGDGNTGFDATGAGTSSGAVRAERTGNLRVPGDGRLYQVNFTASDGKIGGTCSGTVIVGVPHDQGQHNLPADNGCRWNSFTGQPLGPCAWLNAPALTLSTRTNVEGAAINLQITAVDPDGSPLTYGATSLPPGLSMSPSGLITGSIASGAAGRRSEKYTVTVTVSDGYGAVKSTFTWTVTRP
jgi:hypothetical protein